jgi:hypothetical protein
MFRRRARYPSLRPAVVEHPAHVVENLPYVDAAADQIGVSCLDVENDEVQTLN